MSERKPPLARDLSSVRAAYAWSESDRRDGPGQGTAGAAEGQPGEDELAQLRARIATLTDALEDVVTLALSGADHKERAIMMHRRAVAALTGLPVPRHAATPPTPPG